MKPTLDKYGIDFVAVALHAHLADDFLEKTGFKGQLVVNKKKDVWTGVKQAGWLSMLSLSFINQYRKSQALNLGGTVENKDGFQLGGLVVIDPPPHGEIVYQWDQPAMGVYPSVEVVLKNALSGMELVEVADEKKSEVKAPVDNIDVPTKTEIVSQPTNEAVNPKTEQGSEL